MVIVAFLFGMWDLGKLPEMYESDGFWALTRRKPTIIKTTNKKWITTIRSAKTRQNI